MLEGWAIVDNTSGEDWNSVYVGVGSSSALSFRYDLWSVRQVQRETLANEERFAVAPPTGVSPYGTAAPEPPSEVLVSELDEDEIRRPAGHPASRTKEDSMVGEEAIVVTGSVSGRTEVESLSPVSIFDRDRLDAAGAASVRDTVQALPPPPAGRASPSRKPAPPVNPRIASGDSKMKQASQDLVRSDKTIIVESYARTSDTEGTRRATDRANIVRNQLIDQGVAPGRIKIVTKLDSDQPERVRLVAQAAPAGEAKPSAAGKRVDLDAQPVGESHFASERPMTVERGSSAMVAIVHHPTDGEVVYLYDSESERGNANFAFRAVRFKNPTDSTLETGPVTVYGDERFIGEGLTEPIPPHASAVVPYALDRQIVIERSTGEDNKISRLMTLSRGILTAEVQHIRRQRLTITNRLDEVAKVFIRHTVAKGWTLIETPPAFERVGDAHLFEVHLAAHEAKEVVIAEATPVERTLDLNADVTLEMMKVWIEAPDGAPELKDQLRKLLGVHKTLVDLAQAQTSLRRRLTDYRERMQELHDQIFTLQAVKTGGDLMGHLKTKMKDISDRVQKTTIQIVDQEEKTMLARVQFQDLLAELALPDAMAPSARPPGKPVATMKPAAPAGVSQKP